MDGDDGLFGGGVDGVEGLAVDTFDEFTVDEARVKWVRSGSFRTAGQMVTMRGGGRRSRLHSAATRMKKSGGRRDRVLTGLWVARTSPSEVFQAFPKET